MLVIDTGPVWVFYSAILKCTVIHRLHGEKFSQLVYLIINKLYAVVFLKYLCFEVIFWYYFLHFFFGIFILKVFITISSDSSASIPQEPLILLKIGIVNLKDGSVY